MVLKRSPGINVIMKCLIIFPTEGTCAARLIRHEELIPSEKKLSHLNTSNKSGILGDNAIGNGRGYFCQYRFLCVFTFSLSCGVMERNCSYVRGKVKFPPLHRRNGWDGKHIDIIPPVDCGLQFYSYKGGCSMVLLAIVDRILQPDSITDSFRNVPFVMVADDAFFQETRILKQFRLADLDLPDKDMFNYRLSRARRIADNAFRILASRILTQFLPTPTFLYQENTDNATIVYTGGDTSHSNMTLFDRQNQGNIMHDAKKVRKEFMKYFMSEAVRYCKFMLPRKCDTIDLSGKVAEFVESQPKEQEKILRFGAARLACSPPPPIKANRVYSSTGSLPNFRMWESCRTTPLLVRFSRESPVSPALSFWRCSTLTSITLIGSQDLAVKSRPNLFSHSYYTQWNEDGGGNGRAPRNPPTLQQCPPTHETPFRKFLTRRGLGSNQGPRNWATIHLSQPWVLIHKFKHVADSNSLLRNRPPKLGGLATADGVYRSDTLPSVCDVVQEVFEMCTMGVNTAEQPPSNERSRPYMFVVVVVNGLECVHNTLERYNTPTTPCKHSRTGRHTAVVYVCTREGLSRSLLLGGREIAWLCWRYTYQTNIIALYYRAARLKFERHASSEQLSPNLSGPLSLLTRTTLPLRAAVMDSPDSSNAFSTAAHLDYTTHMAEEHTLYIQVGFQIAQFTVNILDKIVSIELHESKPIFENCVGGSKLVRVGPQISHGLAVCDAFGRESLCIPGRVTPDFLIVQDDAVGRRVFSGISRFPRPFIPALLHTRLNHPRLSGTPFACVRNEMQLQHDGPIFHVISGTSLHTAAAADIGQRAGIFQPTRYSLLRCCQSCFGVNGRNFEMDRAGVVAGPFAFHHGDCGSIAGVVKPGFSNSKDSIYEYRSKTAAYTAESSRGRQQNGVTGQGNFGKSFASQRLVTTRQPPAPPVGNLSQDAVANLRRGSFPEIRAANQRMCTPTSKESPRRATSPLLTYSIYSAILL
ncbi:hypothetical protein PR048_023539 [Dryococelus australis]|uniref:Uncharacterized protein n=1 Tax=Dryococelus australis TaxID=614101 RepID=A0ABQ9GUG2_9NEOP|nr:hypothetical protein PR048_023539 [Dryococelus australis]